jgi:hypothetical protein
VAITNGEHLHEPETDRGNPLTAILEDASLCPSCERPCPHEQRISGVCPRCKKNLHSQHGRILDPSYREDPVRIEPLHREHAFYEDGQRVQIQPSEADEPTRGASYDPSLLEKYDTMNRAGLRIVICGGNDKAIANLLKFYFLAMGWHDDLGVKTEKDISKKLGLTKADVNKYTTMFRDVIPPEMNKLPKRAGQRTEASRQIFTEKRIAYCERNSDAH